MLGATRVSRPGCWPFTGDASGGRKSSYWPRSGIDAALASEQITQLMRGAPEEGPRGRRPPALGDAVMQRLAAIEARLTAIERRLGLSAAEAGG